MGLVSVGIPTYNRPVGLRRTLECITQQTYQNLEVIVSDNGSTGEETEKVVRSFMKDDSRVIYYKQEKNKGAINNFKFVLEKSRGKYFMWAADDDEWEDYFIQECVGELEDKGDIVAAAMMEAQYFFGEHRYDFFPEGKAFYDYCSGDVKERLYYLLDHNYGNLFYSVFRKNCLFQNGKSIFELYRPVSLNEISIFIFVASRGNFSVIPRVGIYKQAGEATYRQARWEIEGGTMPKANLLSYYGGLYKTGIYHKQALKDIKKVIYGLEVGRDIKDEVYRRARTVMGKHFRAMVLRYKKMAS